MDNVKILGSGCKKCRALEENTKKAIEELEIEANVEHVTDMAKIVGYGVMSTPALVINDKVVSTGKVLKVEEAKETIKKNINK
ncbi:MAG: thioredoxin family protein [Fusobacterium sp. JB021]|nr:thioredoxin family protein [Fusobacterium sp. JB020]MDP0493041.1 thioredoxin family protein [Fusobacterium sp. JB021]MDP0505792.1 thioredoxin family protein [Fusobacterium sp. JB019]